MRPIVAMSEIGALVGDPGRANMLSALLDGRALSASELAARAGVTPQTGSGHLARLVAAKLVSVERQGRHRYHRLASGEVAAMIEAMLVVAEAGHDRIGGQRLRTGPRDTALRNARTCYDHLAGQLGVALMDALLQGGDLLSDGAAISLTQTGARRLSELGVDVAGVCASKRVSCRSCLDWSERRPHLAGAGAALMDRVFALGWVRRLEDTRAVEITSRGEEGLKAAFDISGLSSEGGPGAEVLIVPETSGDRECRTVSAGSGRAR
jgi:DNA-binding transcriptional ArsR family regulator